ncbi:MAG: hypothetical protein A3E82_00435 [Gammaproteobacteria bacterium RIFCSPHIGHO2_12_FULL_38_11]|nr:MAG: hypothetical protein A3E82_00435 [Gammaproteobacteria bacterium RIFCSPHIGHO2_12_FULL_38_11]
MEKVIIIIPTYNERNNISIILNELEIVFSKIKNYDMFVLVYDSDSSDNTAEVVREYQQKFPNIYLQTEEKKSGLGSAYFQAMQYAIDTLHADFVFEFDADGSHRPEYLPPMMEAFKQGADVVMGSRYVPGGAIPKNWALNRKLLSVLGNVAARIMLSYKIKDYTTGFRGTRVSVLKKINWSDIKSTGYAYKIHLMWLLYLLRVKIVEFPICFVDRKEGLSKLPKNNVLESLLLLFNLRLQRIMNFLFN